MAHSTLLGSLVYILIFIGEFMATSGISISLVVGVLVTVCILLLAALLVTCIITWKRKTDKIKNLLRFRSRPLSNNPPGKNNKPQESKKSKKGLSRSTTNLNNTVNIKGSGLTKSSSCSALDLPLPSEPASKKNEKRNNNEKTTTIYDDDLQMSVMLRENAAYDSAKNNTLANVSVTAMVDKLNKGLGPEEGHEYEQLEMLYSRP